MIRAVALAAVVTLACGRADGGKPQPTKATAVTVAPSPTPIVDPGPPPPRGTHIAVVYGSNGHGEYEPCG